MEKPQETKIKLSLKEIEKKVQTENDGIKKVIDKIPEIVPPMQKGSQLKEIPKPQKKEPIKYDEKKISHSKSTPQLNKSQEPPLREPKPKTEPIPSKKPYIPLVPPVDQSSDPLAWMREDKSEEDSKEKKTKTASGSSVGNSDLRELYGDDFSKFTEGQQKYLIDNQEIMRRITQEILNRVAQVNLRHDMNVNRVNIVEFYLHPNGDMSDFKFLQNSGYHILDATTQETIEFAYSRYPRPKEKILIRYNVFYNLAR